MPELLFGTQLYSTLPRPGSYRADRERDVARRVRELESAAPRETEFERLLKRPRETEFERLLKRPRESEFERLLKRPLKQPAPPSPSALGRIGRVLGPIGGVIGMGIPSELGSGEVPRGDRSRRAHEMQRQRRSIPPPATPPPKEPRTRTRPQPPAAPPTPTPIPKGGLGRPADEPSPAKPPQFALPGDVWRELNRPRRRQRAPIPRRADFPFGVPSSSSSEPATSTLPDKAPTPSTPIETFSPPSTTTPITSLTPLSAPGLESPNCVCPPGQREGRLPRPSKVIAQVKQFSRRMSQWSLDNLRRGRKP